MVYNISPKIKKIEEGRLPKGGIEIKNSFGYKHYGGPCPPPGRPHRYYFKVYALSRKLPENIKTKRELLEYIEKYNLAFGETMGRFKR